ncbi:Auxin response factor 18-like protein [Drosera capensis]
MINLLTPNMFKDSSMGAENRLDPQLWHACAGAMVQMPPVNSRVFYFPQGHIEHAQSAVDFKTFPKLPALVPCRISSIKYLADHETDEVYAKVMLVPLRSNDLDCFSDDRLNKRGNEFEGSEKPASFAKTLTQSDANNGGGFSVPRYCADTIFPRLDYSAEPPVQTILAKDVHGVTWKFRHIYRGTPRRHLLTTGWSNFVNQKKLVAGDSIVFLRAENGDLCVGVRRARRGIGGGLESPGGWNANCGSSPYGGWNASFLRDDESRMLRSFNGPNGGSNYNGNSELGEKVRGESVIETARLAANGQPFEVVYYPRASTPEFCVKASAVRAAMQIQWCSGLRFKMAFETEDSSRISWFMGTVSSVQVADPFHWPNSPWRLLQVAWDEPDLLQNVKRVNPWLVEPVATMPAIHMSPFASPRKKLRLPHHPDFPFLDQLPFLPPFPSNAIRPSSPLCYIPNNISAGIQGARHPQLGQLLSDSHISKLQTGLYGAPTSFSGNGFMCKPRMSEELSSLLTIGSHSELTKKNHDAKSPKFMLFGKQILTEEQISSGSSKESPANSYLEKKVNFSDGSDGPSDGSSEEIHTTSRGGLETKLCLETGHCKALMQSEDVRWKLDLSVYGSYQELYKKVGHMLGVERAEAMSNVLCKDRIGETKLAVDRPFSEFLKTPKTLMIPTYDACGANLY